MRNRLLFLLLLVIVLMVVSATPSLAAITNPFDRLTNPVGQGSLGPEGGLIVLLNNVLRLIFVASGIFAFLKIILAGVGFINAGGDTKKIETAWNGIWQSLFGLVIIVGSFAIAALIGILLFGNAGAILNPQIYGPDSTSNTNFYIRPTAPGFN